MQKNRAIVPCLILTHAPSSDAETQTGAFNHNSNSESDVDFCRFRQLCLKKVTVTYKLNSYESSKSHSLVIINKGFISKLL